MATRVLTFRPSALRFTRMSFRRCMGTAFPGAWISRLVPVRSLPISMQTRRSVCVCSPLCNVPLNDCTTDGGTIAVDHSSANHIGAVGRVSLRYKFPKTSVSFSFQRYDTSGSGIFAGSLSNIAQLDMRRPLTRVWDFLATLAIPRIRACKFQDRQ